MPQKIENHEFAGAGRPSINCWETLDVGSTYRLTRGVDFTETQSTKSLRSSAYHYSVERGYKCQTQVVSDDELIVRFDLEEPEVI